MISGAVLWVAGIGMAALAGSWFAAGVVVALGVVAALPLDVPKVSSAVLVLTLLVGVVEMPKVFGLSPLMILLAICLVALLCYRSTRPELSTIRLPIWSFAIAGVIALSYTGFEALRSLATPAIAGLVVLNLVRVNSNYPARSLGIAAVLHAGIGLTESILHRSIVYTSWKLESAADVGGIRRAASTIGDPNYLAAFLVVSFFGVLLVARSVRPVLRSAVYVVYAAALLLTFSRAAAVAAMVGAVYLIVHRMRRGDVKRGFLAIVGVGSLVGVLVASPAGKAMVERISHSDSSVDSRFVIQQVALSVARENWVSGVGLGNLSEYLTPVARAMVPLDQFGSRTFLPQTDPLNTYLLVAAETGVVGVSLFVVALAVAVVRSRRLAPSLTASVLGIVVLAFALDLLQFIPLWCVVVIAVQADPQRVCWGLRASR